MGATLLILSAASGHTGVVHVRTRPELSDLALFVVAALGVWWLRRRLRARAPGQNGANERRD